MKTLIASIVAVYALSCAAALADQTRKNLREGAQTSEHSESVKSLRKATANDDSSRAAGGSSR